MINPNCELFDKEKVRTILSGKCGDCTIFSIKKECKDCSYYKIFFLPIFRRGWPTLIAVDIMGTQPMSEPTGLKFNLKSIYKKGEIKLHEKNKK